MARTKHPFADDEIVVCFEAFGIGGDFHGAVVAPGMRFRGDDELVKAAPQFFAPDGTSSVELTRRRVGLIQEAERDVPDHRSSSPEQPTEIVQPIADEDAMVAIVGSAAGQRVHKHSLVVEQAPERFVPVVPPNLRRADALEATETINLMGEDGKPVRTIWKGQWARRDDPLVALHPTMFTLPAYVEAG